MKKSGSEKMQYIITTEHEEENVESGTMKPLAMAVLILLLAFSACVRNPITTKNDSVIPEENFIKYEVRYERIPSDSITDTLRLQSMRCDCIIDTIVNRVVTDDYPFSQMSDSLSIQFEQIQNSGREENTVSLSSMFYRVSGDTGLNGIWQFQYRHISSRQPLSSEDSSSILQYNPGIGWLAIGWEKMTVYFYRDSLPVFTTKFVSRYGTLLTNYNVRIDSLSENALNLLGISSGDVISVKKDSTGDVSYSIALSHPEDSLLYQPNPFTYYSSDPELNKSNASPCQEYPEWIHLFLNDNALSE